MRRTINIAIFVLAFLFILPNVLGAASISITQSGADAGTIMLGKTFTVTVTGATSNAQATITLPAGFSLSGETAAKTTNNNGVVSWTTVTANQQSTAQTTSVSISGQGSPETVTSSSFNVITPPSLTATVSPASSSVTQGSTFTISLSLSNSGETAAKFGAITVSPSFFSVSSGCSPADITGGQSSGVSCTIAASSSASTGIQTMTVTIAPSNADPMTKTVSVNVSAAPSQPSGNQTTTTPGVSGTLSIIKGNGTVTAKIPTVIVGNNAVDFSGTANLYFTKLVVNSKITIGNVQLIIVRLNSKPSDISQNVNGAVFNYIDISPTNISDSNINNVTISFYVNKSWTTANNIDSSTVKLYRYSSGSWNELSTVQKSEDILTISYEAVSPGFSTYAIAGQLTGVQPEQNVSQPTEPESSTEPAPENATAETTPVPEEKPFPILGIIFIVIAAVAIVTYFVLSGKIKIPGLEAQKGKWETIRKKWKPSAKNNS